jgi:hypothetical protein
MSTLISADHELLISTVRDFARRELVEIDRRCDRAEASCCTQLDALYELGLLGLRVNEAHGGIECPGVPYAHIIREVAYASPAFAVTIGVHNMVCEAIARYGRPETVDEMLPRLVSKDNLSAFAISEPDAGSDPSSATTRAQRVDGGWKLYGNKMWVTNGLTGRWFIVLARASDAPAGRRDHSMFLLDARQDDVHREQIKGKMGIRGSETAEMRLEGAFVPESRLLGHIGDGLKIALSALDGGRIGIASQAIGICAACLDEMVVYARTRRQFGRPIADFQAIQWMIADSKADLDASQLLVDRAAAMKDRGERFTREASIAKLFASEAANRVAYRAVQVFGGSGFVSDCRVEQLYRDARITTIYEGTSEIQRVVIARELLRGE